MTFGCALVSERDKKCAEDPFVPSFNIKIVEGKGNMFCCILNQEIQKSIFFKYEYV